MPNYEMTYGEMMGGAAGQAAYTSRIASERAAVATPTSATPTTSPPGGNAAVIASTQQQIADVQAKLANLQNISSVASQTGITTGEIPKELIDNPSGYLANWQASNIPITAPDMTTADASYASLDAMLQSQIKAAAGNQAKIDAALATYQEQAKKLYQTSQIDIEGKRKELESQYGADTSDYLAKRQSDLAAVGAMQKDYNAAVAARDLALSGERERMAPMEFITTRMGRMERDANIRLNQMAADVNTRLGIMEMERGNFMDAQSLINQAVENYTAQAKWNYDVTKDYMDVNKDIIDNLNSTQKDILNSVQNLALLKLQETKENGAANEKAIWDTEGKAGVKINDTPEDRAQKVADWLKLQPGTIKEPTENDIAVYIQKRISEGEGWATIESELRAGGINTLTGSTADKLLNQVFGTGTQPFTNIMGQDFTPRTNLTTEQTKKVNVLMTGIRFIDQAEDLYKAAVGGEWEGFGAGVLGRVKGVIRSVTSFTGLNEKLKTYQSFLDSNRATIAKGIKGEVGNLAETEQKKALKAFPDQWSSPAEAKAAFLNLRRQMKEQLELLGTLGSGGNSVQPSQTDIDYINSLNLK